MSNHFEQNKRLYSYVRDLKVYTSTKGTNAADRKNKTVYPLINLPVEYQLVTYKNPMELMLLTGKSKGSTTKIFYCISVKTTTNELIKAPIFPTYHSR